MWLRVVPIGGSLILILYLIVINIVAFLAYGADKQKAKEKKWRTPESVLLMLAVLGGSIGALLGMKVFHHKTKHPKFFIGVPAILILQIIAVYILKFFGP